MILVPCLSHDGKLYRARLGFGRKVPPAGRDLEAATSIARCSRPCPAAETYTDGTILSARGIASRVRRDLRVQFV